MVDWQTLPDDQVIKAYERAMAEYDEAGQDAAAAEMERRNLDY